MSLPCPSGTARTMSVYSGSYRADARTKLSSMSITGSSLSTHRNVCEFPDENGNGATSEERTIQRRAVTNADGHGVLRGALLHIRLLRARTHGHVSAGRERAVVVEAVPRPVAAGVDIQRVPVR